MASRSFTSLETLLCETFLQKHPEAGGVQESTCQKSKRYPHNAEVLTKDEALERMEKFQEAKAKRGKKRSTETNPREVKRREKKRDVSKKKPVSPSPAPSSSNCDNEQPQYADSSELSLNDEQQDSNIYAHFNERSYQNLSKNVKPEHYYAIAYGNLVYIGKTLKKEGIMWETKFLNRGVDYHFDCSEDRTNRTGTPISIYLRTIKHNCVPPFRIETIENVRKAYLKYKKDNKSK